MKLTSPTPLVTATYTSSRPLSKNHFIAPLVLSLCLLTVGGSIDSLVSFTLITLNRDLACEWTTTKLAYGQGDDEELAEDEPSNGLIATIRSGDDEIKRIDDLVSADWHDRTPDPRLTGERFTADWNGSLLIRQEGKYQFHAFVSGKISVKIGERVLLEGEEPTAGWISSEEFDLDFGEPELHVHFEKTAPLARMHLFWSSDSFPLEPISTSLFFHEGLSPADRKIEQGRKLFDVHRCGRCHRRQDDLLPPPAPSLEWATSHINAEWFAEKLLSHRSPESDAVDGIEKTSDAFRPHGVFADKMPEFQLTLRDVQGILAFLRKKTKPMDLQPFPAVDDPLAETAEGRLKLFSLGCLACHHIQDQYAAAGTPQDWNGGSLADVGLKRSAAWLMHWLNRPGDLNSDHRMPTFTLDDKERRQLVLALSELKQHSRSTTIAPQELKIDPFDSELEMHGARVLQQRRCTACHRIPQLQDVAVEAELKPVPSLADKINWEQACIAETNTTSPPESRRLDQPRYIGLDREAIRLYVESRRRPLQPASLERRGELVIEQNGCLACHPRSTSLGMTPLAGRLANDVEQFRGRSSELIPPSLTAMGDKLFDTALSEAVSGQQMKRRLPWLQIRMPRFEHSSENKTALIDYFISRDRIPDDPPATPKFKSDIPLPQQVLAGHTLVGGRGFSCIACHTAGNFQPRGVALGSRGSDLLMLQTRMRKEYFMRWTRSPLRMIPGTEMPSYQRPAPNILDENLAAQLNAVWLGLNDSNFTVPTNPGSVEQYLTLKPGDSPRIIRDVFTYSSAGNESFVPRAFAVGLDNGHSLLFDLDHGAVRQWTIGDFARQRTQGKSWYWDMAGLPLMSEFGMKSDIVLCRVAAPSNKDGKDHESTLTVIEPDVMPNGVAGLLAYEQTENSVHLIYKMTWTTNKGPQTVQLTEVYRAVEPDQNASDDPATPDRTGWVRYIRAKHLPEGYGILVRRPRPGKTFGQATVDADTPWKPLAQIDTAELSLLNRNVDDKDKNRRKSADRRSSENQTVRRAALTNHQKDKTADEFATFTPAEERDDGGETFCELTLYYRSTLHPEPARELPPKVQEPPTAEELKTIPGFTGIRLPLAPSIMPTAITWTDSGSMAISSLKGDIFLVDDVDGDGLEDRLRVFETGLAAPFGIIADGDDLIVAHKPEVIRLRDVDADGRADLREVLASGWGYSEDYHDWTCGIVRDSSHRLYVALGSDYGQPNRPRDKIRWRGKALRIDRDGTVVPLGHDLRFPTGLAIDDEDRVFISDQQGVQNTFNELNLLSEKTYFGVPSQEDLNRNDPGVPPAIQIPHPWTRSVNGITFIPHDSPIVPWRGHGIGCEYDTRFLIRFSVQQIDDAVQGAVYPVSLPNGDRGGENFVGPISVAVGPTGDLYIGSIHDSGWQGGINTGAIERLQFTGELPLGIREVRVTDSGFEIDFTAPVDRDAATNAENFEISGYTRIYQGGYATPDSGRFQPPIENVELLDDCQSVRLSVDGLKEGFIYEIHCGKLGPDGEKSLWPNEAHYTLHRLPRDTAD